MKKIELLAPSGNLEKLKIAVMYGADACYIGGKKFSLRARASNFDLEDIKEACEFARGYNCKIHVTMNIIPHNDDLDGLEEYLIALESYGVHAIIVASLYIASVAKRVAPKLEVHYSTQLSTLNHGAVQFLEKMGADRVVVGREASLESLRDIVDNSNVEIEAFIHGGMCVSYSGRCMLSNHMTWRDANRGGCAHSCRWNYKLFDDGKCLNNENEFFNMGSKDLCAISSIPALIEAGVSSLKIEGRMKTAYYIATVVRCYRNAIDEYYEKGYLSPESLDYYMKEMKKAENRLTATGFLNNFPDVEEQLFDTRCETPTKEFVGFVLDYDKETQICTLEQRNYFKIGDTLEFFGPNLKNTLYKVEEFTDADGNNLEVARHPKQVLKMKVPFELQYADMVRIKIN